MADESSSSKFLAVLGAAITGFIAWLRLLSTDKSRLWGRITNLEKRLDNQLLEMRQQADAFSIYKSQTAQIIAQLKDEVNQLCVHLNIEPRYPPHQ